MTMRLDIVNNDAGELVRREHARDLGAGVVASLYRLARLAQMHDHGNQAFLRQLEQTQQAIGEYCLRAGTNLNVLFAQKAVFIAGQLLKGSRGTYEAATELGAMLEWCGGSELAIARDVSQNELLAFAEALGAAMKGEKGRGLKATSPRIRLRAVNDAARQRGIDVERLPIDQRIVRNYATAVVVLRRFFEDLGASKYVLPRRIKRVAQNLVDLSAGNTPAFLGVTQVRNQNYDAAGRAVNTAILAVATAREITEDKAILSQIAMAAMMHDVGRPRAIALATAGGPKISQLVARLSEDAEDKLPNGTAAVLTALGRVNEPSITRTVIAFESLWQRRASSLGPVYRGARQPTLHARIVTLARRYNDLLTPEPGLAPPTPDHAIGQLAIELTEPADRTVLRMLVAALGVTPVGTVVQLSTGEVGEVVGASDRGKPRVRVAMDAKGGVLAAPIDVDLAKTGETRTIARVMSVDGWTKAADGVRVAQAADPSSPSRSAVVPTTEPRVKAAAPAPPESPPPPRPQTITTPVPPSAMAKPGAIPAAPSAPTAMPPAPAPHYAVTAPPPGPQSSLPTSAPPALPDFPGMPPLPPPMAAAGARAERGEGRPAVAPPPPPPAPRPTAKPPVVEAPADAVLDDPSNAGTSPSAVAEAMGRMIEEALRGAPAPAPKGDAPISMLTRAAAPVAPPATEPPAAQAPPAPPAPPKEPPRPTAAPPRRVLAITDAPPPKPPPEGYETLSEMKAAPAKPASEGPNVATARGTLGATPLAHVLVYMLDHALTGSIAFCEPAVTSSQAAKPPLEHVLHFQLGAVCKVQLARPSSRLGDELVAAGLVARPVINEAVEGARRLGVLLGEYLVGSDIVTREALAKTLENQVANRVASLVNLSPETTYTFHRDVDLLQTIATEAVVGDPLNVILATVRAWHDRARIRATLARIQRHPLIFHPDADPASLALTPPERACVDYIRQARPTASQLFQKQLADEETVSSLIYALAVTRQFGLKGQKKAPMGGKGAAIPISIAPPARSDSSGLKPMPSMRPSELPEDMRVSVIPDRSSQVDREEARALQAAGLVGGGGASTEPNAVAHPAPPAWIPPNSLSERPAPIRTTSSDVQNAERALEAMTHFRLAESALQRGDIAQAERMAARAMASDPEQSDYAALHAWVRTLSSTDEKTAHEAVGVLSRLLIEEPESERALFYRGKLLKRVGRTKEALRDFERVLLGNPRHREAATEVRLLKPRATK